MPRRGLELDTASDGALAWPEPRPLSALTMPLSWTTHDSHARARPRFRSAMRKRACCRPRLGLLVIVRSESLES
jgi:hypothetical protein